MTDIACDCAACAVACTVYPGRFSPRGVVRYAAHLGVSLDVLAREHITFDTWFGGFDDIGPAEEIDEDVTMVAPVTTTEAPGTGLKAGSALHQLLTQFSFEPTPTHPCAAFQHGRCAIHAVKPVECRWYVSTKCERHPGVGNDTPVHRYIARAWARPAGRRLARALLAAAGHPSLDDPTPSCAPPTDSRD